MARKTTTTPATTTNPTINSIIEVQVNGLSVLESIEQVRTLSAGVEKTAFNIAILVAHGTGVKIPAHTDSKGVEHAEAICEKPMKQCDFIDAIGRTKSTISKWLKAFNYIVENGYFLDFAYGVYPFSFDKINLIFDEDYKKTFESFALADLMGMTVKSLESLAGKQDKKSKKTEPTKEEQANTEEHTEPAEQTTPSEEPKPSVKVSFVYNDKRYFVDKVAFEKWLEENATDEQLAENAELK